MYQDTFEEQRTRLCLLCELQKVIFKVSVKRGDYDACRGYDYDVVSSVLNKGHEVRLGTASYLVCTDCFSKDTSEQIASEVSDKILKMSQMLESLKQVKQWRRDSISLCQIKMTELQRKIQVLSESNMEIDSEAARINHLLNQQKI